MKIKKIEEFLSMRNKKSYFEKSLPIDSINKPEWLLKLTMAIYSGNKHYISGDKLEALLPFYEDYVSKHRSIRKMNKYYD